MHQRFRFKNGSDLLLKAKELGLNLPYSKDISPLLAPALIEGKKIVNRLIVQPMEGYDSEPDGSPSELTIRRYHRYSAGGSGLIWFEALAVRNDGRSNPGQLMLTPGNVGLFEKLINEIRDLAPGVNNPFLVAQITHSGRYSRPEGIPRPLVPQKNKILDKGSPVVLSDMELHEIQDNMIIASKLAFQAGFDAVDIKACHGYLVHELLSARDRKESLYGGPDTDARFRFLLETIDRIKSEIPGLIVTTRLNISDLYTGGFGTCQDGKTPDLSEPLLLIGEIRKRGVRLINITMGSPYFNPFVVRPFDAALPGASPPDEHPMEGVVRMIENTGVIQHKFQDMLIVGSAYSWLRQFAPNTGAAVIMSGDASFIGFGRSSFAYPDMPLDLIKHGKANPEKVCITCSGCTRLINNLRPGGCVTRDRQIYGKELKKLVRNGK